MALISAMTLWAGQLIIDDYHIIASPSSPNPGETVTLTVDFSNEMLVMRLSDLLVYEEVGGNLIEPPLTVTLLPGTPDPLAFPYIGYYTFTMPTSGNDVHVFSVFAHSPVHCMQSNNGSCQVSLVEGQPLPPGSDPQNPQVGDNFEVTLTATPNPGFELASYYVIAESGQAMIVDANGVFYKPDGPVQVYANFKTPGTHFVNIDPNYILNPNSDLDVFANPEYASDGTLVRLDVNPRPSDVWVRNIYYKSYPDGNNIWQDVFVEDGQLWFKMPDPDDDVLVNVITDYSPTASDPHQISIASGITGGSVAVSQPQAARGEIIRLDLYPDPGHMIGQVFVDDLFPDKGDRVEVRPNGNQEYLFTMPGGHDVTVSATFVPNSTYNINVDQTISGGTVAAMNTTQGVGGPGVPIVPAQIGNTVVLSNTPASGYRFDYYIVTNDNDNSDVLFSDNLPGYSTRASDFMMPGNDVNVSAVFVPNDYPITLNVLPNAAAGNVNVPPTGVYGDQIPINIQPNAGYTISQVYYEYRQGGQIVRITVNHDPLDPADQYFFTMPAYRVTLTVVFDPGPHNLNVVTFYTGGSIYVDKIDGLPQTPYQPNFYPVVTGAVVDLSNTPNTGYSFVAYELTCDDEPSYNVTLTTNSFTMPPHDVNVLAKFELNQHKVVVRRDPHGKAEAWWLAASPIPAFDNGIYNPIDYNGFVSLNVTACDIGYEFDHYELYDLGSYPGPQLTGLWQNPPDNTDFLMPDCDVLVVPVFRKKTFYIVYDNRPNPGASLQIRNVTQGTISTVLPAEMGDIIEMTATETPPLSNFPFDYFTFDEYDMNIPQVIGNLGEMSGHTFVSPLSYVTRFTMPPLDLLIGAYFWDPNGPTMPPPPNPIEMWTNITISGGIVLLHRVYQTKSSTFWDEPQNYGWSDAKPGQPMYFTVMPDLGFQVNKSEITVQLVDASQGEEGGKSRVIKELKGGPEIFGPDEYVTEPTDYYFIFDVPEDMDPNKVQVKIFANFNPVDYTITVDGAIEHGTITAPAGANADDIVTLTVNPEPGYRLESITVTTEEPGFLVTVDSNNQFTMPACNVFVSAQFQESEFDLGDVNGDGFISIADVTTLIDYLLSGDVSLINSDAADCHQDGYISIADVTALIDYLLSGSW